jgi:hypothetical protein
MKLLSNLSPFSHVYITSTGYCNSSNSSQALWLATCKEWFARFVVIVCANLYIKTVQCVPLTTDRKFVSVHSMSVRDSARNLANRHACAVPRTVTCSPWTNKCPLLSHCNEAFLKLNLRKHEVSFVKLNSVFEVGLWNIIISFTAVWILEGQQSKLQVLKKETKDVEFRMSCYFARFHDVCRFQGCSAPAFGTVQRLITN